MRAVCANFETEPVEFNGEHDHVHLLVHHPPKVTTSRLIGSLNGVSARRLRQEFPGHIANACGAITSSTVQTRAPVQVAPILRSDCSRP
ncbi:hypothetical protein SRB17_49920 [Streptomyces sp. RB17]|nr:hypothetical protein [Streptomyces sp. RB17]